MSVTVVNGPTRLPVTLSGATVRELIDELGDTIGSIPDDAQITVNGENASYDSAVEDGDTVAFNKEAGSKGI